jgi:UDP-glucuronate 4-epimerase
MSYLITGGAGFIGSHVAERLLLRGERVIVLDNFNDYYDPAIKRASIQRIQHENLSVVEGDIRDAELVKKLFTEHGVRKVAHLAAMAGVRMSVNETPLYMQVNTLGSMNLFEAARDNEIEQFVLASTSSVYGATKLLPFIETDTADRPLAAYPASKRAAEMLAYTYHNLNKQNYTILRFFNVYGPAGRPDMMPMRLMQASQDGSEIKLFNGGDISRDWTFIDDTVDGVIAALDRPLGYEVINLGIGNPISLTDFVEIVEELSGKEINKVTVGTPLSDPPITYCDNSKARELLGFNPKVTVQEGLVKTWEWFRDFYKLT